MSSTHKALSTPTRGLKIALGSNVAKFVQNMGQVLDLVMEDTVGSH